MTKMARSVTDGMLDSCTKLAPDLDLKKENETHSPLTVINE